MFQTLKITEDPSKVFAISDLHYNHNPSWDVPLWKMRGFNSSSEHDEGIIAAWNSACDNESVVFHLGDFVFRDPKAEFFNHLVKSLNFKRLYLLPGNHNSGQKPTYYHYLNQQFPDVAARGCEVFPLYADAEGKEVVFLPQYVEVKAGRRGYVLCHYPVASWNNMKDGVVHLSGHCHSNYARSNKITGIGRQLDVGFDSFRRPLSLEEIEEFLQHREILKVDHHF